ncbi:MAG TPA: hypothetical protein VFE92_13170 [Dermatophilaceae bacterium]|jgi:hypothetical protein|nr:hypothetical protein [Dermatophilaceae bacterium]
MHHARRVIAIIISCTTWSIAAATAAFAQLPPDPVGSGDSVVVIPASTTAQGTPLWQFVATAALGVILALAVVGLVLSLRQSPRSEQSRRTQTSMHA